MPITMSGSPTRASPYGVESLTKVGSPTGAMRRQRDLEFQSRIDDAKRKEALHNQYEKEKRREMTAKLEKRLEFSPGHGPTKYLWPTAYNHPRTYVSGGELLLGFGTVVHQHGGRGTGVVIGSPANRDTYVHALDLVGSPTEHLH